jgi:hypothetical protein
MNEGERAELKFIATMGCYNNKQVKFKNGTKPLIISKLETPTGQQLQTISPYTSKITPQFIRQLDDADLVNFCNTHKISKSGPFSKADIFVNGIGYSLKYSSAMPPALINHTRRTGWEFAALQKSAPMSNLDKLVADYWNKRLAGIIGEDIANSDSRSPFAAHFNTLLPFLEYFTFEGTGSRVSNHPASEVIEFSDPCDIQTWDLLNRSQILQNLWPRLIFSMRSGKGMPSDINFVSQNEKNSIMVWAKKMQGSLKGALHVRIR